MALTFRHPVVLQLRDGELLPVDDAWVSVVHGCVWITQAQDSRDHFLHGGQALRVAPGARALMSAEGWAQVQLIPAPTRLQLWARAGSQWLTRLTRRRRRLGTAFAG